MNIVNAELKLTLVGLCIDLMCWPLQHDRMAIIPACGQKLLDFVGLFGDSDQA